MYVMSRYWRCVFCGLGFKLEVMDAIITRCLHTYNLLCAKYHFGKENICLDCKSTVGAEWYLAWGLKVHSYCMWLSTYVIFILDAFIILAFGSVLIPMNIVPSRSFFHDSVLTFLITLYSLVISGFNESYLVLRLLNV